MSAHVNGGGDGPLTTSREREVPHPLGGAGAVNQARPSSSRRARAHARSEPTVADLTWMLMDRRWSVMGVTAAALAFAVAFIFVTPPTYESSVLIQVEGRSRPVTAFEDLAVLFQEATPIEGEMLIMRSRTLLEAVINELHLDVEVRPRTLPVIGDAFARRHDGPGLASVRFGLLRFAWGGERIDVERFAVSDALLGEPLVIVALEGGRYRVAARDGTVFGEGDVGETYTGVDGDRRIELLLSEMTARPETEFTIEKRRRIDVVEELQRALQISEQGRHTGLVEVALAGPDPIRIAAILDAVSTNYRRQSIERTSAEAAKTLAILEAQLPVLKSNLEKAERSLNAFHRKNGTANLSLGGEQLLVRLGEIDRSIAENEVQLAEMTHRFTEKHPGVGVLTERIRRLHSQRGAGLAVLATIPRSAAQRRVARRGGRGRLSALSVVKPGDAAVEGLRSLRTSVQFALRAVRNNVVSVSGIAPGAGKSFASVNLAHLFAAAGGRVLLVDGDLRRGSLHRYFGMDAAPGLADVMRGATPIDVALRATDTTNLDVLPAGTLPASPAELLASDKLKQLLNELRLKDSVVIVDTPPILSVSDSALVGRHAGVNLLVLRAGEHSVGEISYVVKRLFQNGVEFRGAILNGVRPSSMRRYGNARRYRTYDVGAA